MCNMTTEEPPATSMLPYSKIDVEAAAASAQEEEGGSSASVVTALCRILRSQEAKGATSTNKKLLNVDEAPHPLKWNPWPLLSLFIPASSSRLGQQLHLGRWKPYG